MSKTVAITMGVGALVLGIFLYNRPARQQTESTPELTEATVAPPAPVAHVPTALPPVDVPPQETIIKTNSVLRYLHGEELPKLTDAQLEPFLALNKRSAGSLLAAFRTTGESNYLREALGKYPNDPRVNYAAACSAYLTPDERRQAMEALKQSDPNNALGNYLSAADDFKSGQHQQAVQEMAAAAQKPGWQDYTADFIQNAQEAYLSAGYPELEAKYIAAASALLPDLAPMKSVGVNLAQLAQTYQQAGDTASAQSLLQSAMNLGQQLNSSQEQPVITTLVGIAIQKIALNAMDPSAPYGGPGQTVQDQLNALTQQRAIIQSLVDQTQPLVNGMNDQELLMYIDRKLLFGPLPAYQWALQKYGP